MGEYLESLKKRRQIFKDWLEGCEEVEEGLTEWEQGFVIDMRAWYEAGKDLTPGQQRILERIYREKAD